MSGLSIFDISGRAMSAQLVRLNTTASNLANAGSIAKSEAEVYRARKPVFETVFDETTGGANATVKVDEIVTSTATPVKRYDPGHPLADKQGYIYEAAVDQTQEMVELLEASRQYQNNVEVIQTAKSLMLNTLKLGQ
ncbi:flagellar basal body rod protein FlgC [Tardibacter chloracetimidivorans]|uniref:Flagellar basal-body rod protein FlgC n=1 Tax=Tardibacter chloracetimidivorans TaxID=1921510 RepID=A0A1L3ZUD7_9SPHN|nr:flagellar basal body rod protein FlgC [Tardibacter chloracetimidivorans]API59238.1 flagellar basal body rod protein FlgC [Tardibacter chloracetimidivorans]